MKLSYKILSVLAALAITNIATAQNFSLPKYTKTILANGLTVYLMEQHEVPMISVSAVMPAGAIYDGSQSGLASLTALSLKHGTTGKTKNQLDEALDFVGASLTTYSDKEYAGLSATFASKDKGQILPLIKDVLVNPSFNADEFTKEKQRKLVSLEQAKESPGRVIGNYFDQLYYGNNLYANPAGGKPETVANISTGDVKAFYKSHFIPNGSAIAIVGDFKTIDMAAMVATLFKDWKKGTLPVANITSIPAPAQANVLLVNKDDASETTFYIGGPGISFNNPDKVAIDVINTFFGGRFTSWLNDELRVNSGLTYGARSGFVPQKNAGVFRISTFTANKNTETAIDKALEVLTLLHEKGVDETTLTSAKNYVKGQYPPQYETSGQLADLLTEMYWYGFTEDYINNFTKNVDGLTVAKANQIVQQYFPEKNLQFVLIGKADEIRSIAAKYGTVKEVELKEVTK